MNTIARRRWRILYNAGRKRTNGVQHNTTQHTNKGTERTITMRDILPMQIIHRF